MRRTLATADLPPGSAWIRVHYDLRLHETSYGTARNARAEFDELRAPNTWGDPGRLLARRIVRGTLSTGVPLHRLDDNTYTAPNARTMRVSQADPRPAIRWQD